jgi:hypothetical protein
MSILKVHLSRLRNEVHIDFHTRVRGLLDRFTAAKTVVVVFYPRFVALIVIERKLVDAQQSSDFTPELIKADNLVDSLIVGINHVVEAGLHSYIPATVVAATSIHARMKVFGNMGKKAYGIENTALRILIDDLEENYAIQVSILGLPAWLSSLTNAITEFERLFSLRYTELATRPKEKLLDVRKEIDGVYREMVVLLDADGALNKTASVLLFIDELNKRIVRTNKKIPHHVRTEMKSCMVDEVPEQEYTGYEIVVNPNIYDGKTGRKLVAGQDYNFFSRNNIGPGPATITFTGKGEYKGQKTISFNIKRKDDKAE